MNKLDEFIFDGQISPFSIFRGITGYFHHKDCIAKYSFKFMSGIELEELSTNIDYIFVDDNIPIESIQVIKKELNSICINRKKLISIIKVNWICDCFRNQRLISIKNYTL
jgi:hypothetical protein